MSTLTPEDITRLLELEARATPGAQEARYVPSGMPTDCCQFGIISLATGRETARVWSRDDVEFYAAARNSLRPLCERVRELEAENERLRAERNLLSDVYHAAFHLCDDGNWSAPIEAADAIERALDAYEVVYPDYAHSVEQLTALIKFAEANGHARAIEEVVQHFEAKAAAADADHDDALASYYRNARDIVRALR